MKHLKRYIRVNGQQLEHADSWAPGAKWQPVPHDLLEKAGRIVKIPAPLPRPPRSTVFLRD